MNDDEIMTASECLRTLLRGTVVDDHPLAKLRGIRDIWEIVAEFEHLLLSAFFFPEPPDAAYVKTGSVEFPAPRGVNVNMMPFSLIYLPESLPENCHQYIDMINKRAKGKYIHLNGTTGYLTVQEGYVPVGTSQHIPGMHVEALPYRSPPCYTWDTHRNGTMVMQGHCIRQAYSPDMLCGEGDTQHVVLHDGIYMASSRGKSTAVWPCRVQRAQGLADVHGGLEHVRQRITRPEEVFGQPELMEANEMYWLTDHTPHESLPLFPEEGEPLWYDAAGIPHVYRQFFRLVTGKVDVWYARHNTPNPCHSPNALVTDDDKLSENPRVRDLSPLSRIRRAMEVELRRTRKGGS